jgi:hypothetical protein
MRVMDGATGAARFGIGIGAGIVDAAGILRAATPELEIVGLGRDLGFEKVRRLDRIKR